MYCTNCGIDLGPSAKFCSSCGKSLADATTVAPAKARDWDLHVQVLGWLVIAHAALVGALGLIVMVGGVFVRKLLVENPSLLLEHADPNDLPPAEIIHILGPATFLIGILFLVIALPSIIAGIGLLRYRSWGRGLTLVLSFLRLLEFPFGTATAVYSFWVLLSQGGKRFYNDKAARAEA